MSEEGGMKHLWYNIQCTFLSITLEGDIQKFLNLEIALMMERGLKIHLYKKFVIFNLGQELQKKMNIVLKNI